MESLAGYTGQNLTWVSSPTAKRAYELRDGELVFATLVQPGLWKQDRVATTASGQWTLTLSGWTNKTLSIMDMNGVEAGRVKRSSWGRGSILEWGDGSQYTWRATNWWGGKWAWLDANERPIVGFTQQGMFRRRCLVTLAPDAALSVDPALLAALGWDLIQIQNAEAAAVSAATTVHA